MSRISTVCATRFARRLHCAGASQREAQELMRHSDPRLTAATYTDTKRLGLRAAVGKAVN